MGGGGEPHVQRSRSNHIWLFLRVMSSLCLPFHAPSEKAGRGARHCGTGGLVERRAASDLGLLRLGTGAAIGQVWTHHCRSSRACPTAFIALSVHHMFVRPVAVLVFQTVPCPCLPGWGQSCGPQVLGFTAWAHYSHDTESGSWRVCGVPCLGLPLYFGGGCLCWPLLATHPWLCGLPGSWRARGARGTGARGDAVAILYGRPPPVLAPFVSCPGDRGFELCHALTRSNAIPPFVV